MPTNPLTTYLETYRLRTGFTLSELAFLLGALDGKSVSRHENGKRIPILRTALAYSFVLQVSVEDLYEGLVLDIRHGVQFRARGLRRSIQKRPLTKKNERKLAILTHLVQDNEQQKVA